MNTNNIMIPFDFRKMPCNQYGIDNLLIVLIIFTKLEIKSMPLNFKLGSQNVNILFINSLII